MPRLMLLLVLSSLAGCHLVFGHDPGKPAADGARAERGALDGHRIDGTSDLSADRGHCAVVTPPWPPGYAPTCPSATAGCPNTNKDCDGLGSSLDPYPSECNQLVLEETFAKDVLSARTWNAYSKHDSWRWSCGRLSQIHTTPDDETPDEAASAVAAGVPLPAHYLVEARITLGAAAAREHWRVGVISRVTDDASFHFIGCSIWENPHAGSGNNVPDPDLVLTVHTPFVTDNGWPYPHKLVPGLDGKDGSSYTLQLFYSADIVKLGADKSTLYPACTTPTCPVVFCRACTETSCFHSGFMAIYNSADPKQSIPAGPGTVGFRTFNRAASFERIRVYELKQP